LGGSTNVVVFNSTYTTCINTRVSHRTGIAGKHRNFAEQS